MAALTDEQIKALQDQLTAVTKERDSLKIAKEAAELQAKQALDVVAEFKQKLADQAAGVVEIPSITVGKETYEFISDFFWKDKEITLEVLKEDAKLAQELVKQGVANLRLVKKKA